jgi:CRISPR system Cascade subunit CasE
MYLSWLLIDLGDNPDRPRPGRLWLRNLYHVHQRLCMAFPSEDRKSCDKHFLEPFRPADFGGKQVHVRREADSGFLFRIDPQAWCDACGDLNQAGGRAVILVQSAVRPDWEYAFHNAGYLLAAPPEVKLFEPRIAAGQRLRFRLVANPTKKIDTIRQQERQRYTKEELGRIEGRHGRRVPVPSSEELSEWRNEHPNGDARAFISSRLLDWIESKAEPSGFSLEQVSVQPSYTYWKKPEERNKERPEDQKIDTGRRRSVRYDGTLAVTDPALFRETIIRGIGPGKAFGLGLLSVAPCPAPLAGEAMRETRL